MIMVYPVGGMVGFLKSLAYSIREVNPTRVIIVYDGEGGSPKVEEKFTQTIKEIENRVKELPDGMHLKTPRKKRKQ